MEGSDGSEGSIFKKSVFQVLVLPSTISSAFVSTPNEYRGCNQTRGSGIRRSTRRNCPTGRPWPRVFPGGVTLGVHLSDRFDCANESEKLLDGVGTKAIRVLCPRRNDPSDLEHGVTHRCTSLATLLTTKGSPRQPRLDNVSESEWVIWLHLEIPEQEADGVSEQSLHSVILSLCSSSSASRRASFLQLCQSPLTLNQLFGRW